MEAEHFVEQNIFQSDLLGGDGLVMRGFDQGNGRLGRAYIEQRNIGGFVLRKAAESSQAREFSFALQLLPELAQRSSEFAVEWQCSTLASVTTTFIG